MPWGRVEGAAPGYPAAAARPFQSSCNDEQTLTDSRPSDGRLAALSGTRSLVAGCCMVTSPSSRVLSLTKANSASARLAELMSNTGQDCGVGTLNYDLCYGLGKFSSTPTPSGS